MARWIKHEGCANCGSRDNVGVWDDGSKFCFGCHWLSLPTFAGKLARLHQGRFEAQNYESWLAPNVPWHPLQHQTVSLPFDFKTNEMPAEPFKWISQYLNHHERERHEIGWSEDYERLIFPIRAPDNKLSMWTGRSFAKRRLNQTKYLTMGPKSKILHVISAPFHTDRVVFTEDIVSAIKVSSIATAVPLFGSKFPLEHATNLSKSFSQAIFWLDPDMKKSAIEQAIKIGPWFESVRVVFSEHDPKDYDTEGIRELLE